MAACSLLEYVLTTHDLVFLHPICCVDCCCGHVVCVAVYGQNFRGRYCRCEGEYHAEEDTMVQCVRCQEWFHDRCLSTVRSHARTRLSER
jgi:hypothetical protein